MIDWDEEEKYKQSTSICVEFDNRAQVVDNLTRRSTVFEVLHRLLQELNLQEGNWVFVEQWRGVERPLPPRTRILRVWHAWCNEQRNVTFKLQKAAANQQRFHQHPKKRRRPIVKGPGRYIEETWTDTDSVSSDSSDSVLDDSINTSDSESENDDLNDSLARDDALSRVREQSAQLEKLSLFDKDLDERIRVIEKNIHVASLCNSIQDYKEQTQLLDDRLCSTKLAIVGLQQTIRDEKRVAKREHSAEDALLAKIESERARLEAEIKKQMVVNDRLEVEAFELSEESNALADSVSARQELLTKCGIVPPDSDSEFYAQHDLEVSLDNSHFLDGTVDRFIDVSAFDTSADAEDADDEDTEDAFFDGRRFSVVEPGDSQLAQMCFNCPGCVPKNRQSGSSDSGHVSDDSKITSSSSDAFSFTDSAISSLSSQDAESPKFAISKPSSKGTFLWKTESTDTESDIFTSREVYAKQLRKNSKIIRSASIKAAKNAPKTSKISAPVETLSAKIIETLV